VTFLVDGVRVSAELANANRAGTRSVHAELQSLLDDMTGDPLDDQPFFFSSFLDSLGCPHPRIGMDF
jgi:hypothetical protein